ncbi:hypothetical protein [Luteolibacter marinus]|uniref:hypothetical protein n=1 Tax=Luteolibacter marinus TaxID=2776705 RepID=UPI00186916B8|nr:hypothetical protein [Luteolibacter marinus]
MLESPYFLPGALGLLAALQIILLIALLRLSAKVSRLFRLIASPVPPASQELADRKEAGQEQSRRFEEFLAEDPGRRDLPKKEQFAAFRRWRDERGLNWKNPGDSA